MRIGPSLRSPASSHRKQTSAPFLPHTFTEDSSQSKCLSKEKDVYPAHKRTSSECLSVPSLPTGLELYSPQHSALSGPRASSPNPEEDMSESEQLIWTIIKQRVSQTDLVVEERDEEEEEEPSPAKLPPKELKTAVNFYIKQRQIQQQSQSERRKAVKSRLLTLLSASQDEEKLSQRQTPEMSDVLRSSNCSNGTVTGPGGSFHMQDIGVSEEDRILAALRTVCLPGEVFRKRREEVEAEVGKCSQRGQKLVILLSNSFPINQFAGIYALNHQSRYLLKATPSVPGPHKVSLGAIATYLAFNPSLQAFEEVTKLEDCEAVRLSQPRCYY